MRVKWTRKAGQDINEAITYIAQDDQEAAKKVASIIRIAGESLLSLSNRGRPGFVEGTRELLIPNIPYFLVYWMQNNNIEILRVLHFSQKWPRLV